MWKPCLIPAFPTDMQAQMMMLATISDGDCAIAETVFENRMNHVPEMNRMGADIRLKKGVALVRGVPTLSGAPVASTDLRAAAALVIAGCGRQWCHRSPEPDTFGPWLRRF